MEGAVEEERNGLSTSREARERGVEEKEAREGSSPGPAWKESIRDDRRV